MAAQTHGLQGTLHTYGNTSGIVASWLASSEYLASDLGLPEKGLVKHPVQKQPKPKWLG